MAKDVFVGTANAQTVYDVLEYMRPQSPQFRSRRTDSGYPNAIKSPIYPGGVNAGAGGLYEYSNIFYTKKTSEDTKFEKFSYDPNYIYILRDADWNDGGSAANGADYNVPFPVSSVPNAAGPLSDGSSRARIPVQPGDIAKGVWAHRFMTVGQFVNVGYADNNVPSYIRAFKREQDPANANYKKWNYVPGEDFEASAIVKLHSAGTIDFGGDIGSRQYIAMSRSFDFTHNGCPIPNSGCPKAEERYYYALGIGYIRFELYDRYGNLSSNVTWNRSSSDLGTIRDVEPSSGSNEGAIDPAFSTVTIKMAHQLTSKRIQLFFATQQENFFSEDKSVILTANNGGGWIEYTFNFSGNAKWKGNITGLRFDATDTPGGVTSYPSCGCFGWAYMRIGRETGNSGRYSAQYNVSFSGDTQNFNIYNLSSYSWVQPSPSEWAWTLAPTANDPWMYRTGLFINGGR
jgi:hypothetical protein